MRTDARFYYVWNPQGQPPRQEHADKKAAAAEAERLAKLNPGQVFFVIRTIGVARVDPAPSLYKELLAAPSRPEPREDYSMEEWGP